MARARRAVNAQATPGGRGRAAPEPRWAVLAPIPVWPGLCVAALVGAVYLTLASGGTLRFRPSSFPYHVLIADAWLHGQLNVRDEILRQRSEPFYQGARASVEQQYRARGRQLAESEWSRIRAQLRPPASHDWSYVNGKYYGYWAPLPAALLLPLVAVAGTQASDVLLCCLFGAANVFLVYLMLREVGRRGFMPMTTPACAALALLLGLGTVHFYLTVVAQVWFFSQIAALFFLTLAVYCVARAGTNWWWALAAGVAFGASYLSRNSELMTAPFFLCALFATCPPAEPARWRRLTQRALAFSLPLVIAGAVMLAFNYARFGSLFDDGVRIQLQSGASPRFLRDYLQHGTFSLYWVPRNVYYYFLNPMLRRFPTTNAITFDPSGNSMFLVTPALLYVFRAFHCRNGFMTGVWLG